MRKHITLAMLGRIAQAGANGRLLAVNTTDLDTGTSRVFDLVAEAQRAVDSGQVDRVHNIMLASAGIPGAFPFRMIDNELYVDGGVTGNIIYGGGGAAEGRRPAPPAAPPPPPPSAADPVLGDFQQSVPPGAGSDGAELARGRATQPGDLHACGHGDRAAAPVRDGRNLAAQAPGRRRGAYRVDPRRVGAA